MIERLRQDPGLLERGLALVEEDLEIGRSRLDLLCVDPARRPVLVYLVANAADSMEIPLRVLDGDAEFRRHTRVLGRLLPGCAIDWEMIPRAIVVGREIDRRTMERFDGISALEVDLVELRAIKIRGEERWAGVPVAGEAAKEVLLPPAMVPETLEDEFTKGLWHSVYDRILKLDGNLDVLSDKYYREISSAGRPLAVMESGGREFRVLVPADEHGDRHHTVQVGGEEEADRAVDLVIRRFLAIRTAMGENSAAPEPATPTPDLEAVQAAVGASQLTDEEISAFLDQDRFDPEGE